jgi:hypothetical protein
VPLTTAYRQQCFADNPHLLAHEYRLILLQHVGATPVRLQRVATLATRSPAGTSALGDAVSAAAEIVGAGYTAGGLPVTVTVDVVGETPRLLFTSALWQSITADIRGAVLYNKTLEDLGSTSILGWLDAAELITRTAEPLRVSVLDGVFAVLLPEGETGTVGLLAGEAAIATAAVTPGTVTSPIILTGTAPVAAASVTPGTAQPLATDHPLEPAGFTLINERAYNTLTDTVWSNNQRITDGGTIITDATAPKSPSNVVRLFYPAGTSMDGGEPWSSGYDFPTDREFDRIYCSFWFKFSSNWKNHAASVNKIYYWRFGDTGGRERLYALARGLGGEDSELRLEAVRQGGPAGGQQLLTANVNTSARIVRGQWHRAVFLVAVNTPGSANGTVRGWLDGVEVLSYTDVTLIGTGETAKCTGFEDTAVWGGFGGGVVIPAPGQEQWHDHLYLSGANF